ncbi:MAG: hypothetical protein ACLFU0_04720 [Alphaproteobacteria bacterium]
MVIVTGSRTGGGSCGTWPWSADRTCRRCSPGPSSIAARGNAAETAAPVVRRQRIVERDLADVPIARCEGVGLRVFRAWRFWAAAGRAAIIATTRRVVAAAVGDGTVTAKAHVASGCHQIAIGGGFSP